MWQAKKILIFFLARAFLSSSFVYILSELYKLSSKFRIIFWEVYILLLVGPPFFQTLGTLAIQYLFARIKPDCTMAVRGCGKSQGNCASR